jgi:hypothetical protein
MLEEAAKIPGSNPGGPINVLYCCISTQKGLLNITI